MLSSSAFLDPFKKIQESKTIQIWRLALVQRSTMLYNCKAIWTLGQLQGVAGVIASIKVGAITAVFLSPFASTFIGLCSCLMHVSREIYVLFSPNVCTCLTLERALCSIRRSTNSSGQIYAESMQKYDVILLLITRNSHNELACPVLRALVTGVRNWRSLTNTGASVGFVAASVSREELCAQLAAVQIHLDKSMQNLCIST